MAIPMNRLGGNAFSHSPNNDAEAEYDRLRDLAREEAKKRGDCFDRSRRAYDDGDGAAAKQLSNEGKQHGSKMEQYNKQASEFIFRENNAPGRHPDDTIDLHGQFVEEAEDILEERIRYATQQGQSHLHVIVGKGNHSTNHVQKIKPRVEQVCRELGLKYHTEENAGRMYINLTGGEAVPPPHQGGGGGGSHSGQHQQPHHGGGGQQQHHGGQQHGGQQQQHGGSGQQQGQDPVEKLIGKLVRKLGDCCTVM